MPFTVLCPFLEQFDLNLITCLSCVLQCSLPPDSWSQVTLPFRLGGLGLRSSSHQGKPSQKNLLTEAEKQVDECYCKNLERLLQRNDEDIALNFFEDSFV